MEESNKYYTPEIEEFHVSFEFEKRGSNDRCSWNKCIFNREDLPHLEGKDSLLESISNHYLILDFRVKYLDKEDIESLGWKDWSGMGIYEIDGSFPEGDSGSPKPVFRLMKSPIKNKIEIRCDNPSIHFGNFMGICKNKSELRKVMNQLGIKNK